MEGSTEHQEWTGAILAGGRARRLGGHDKASLIVDGQTILSRQLAALGPVASRRLVIASDSSRYADYQVEVVPDIVAGLGPLGGIYTALRAATTPAVLIVACDMPFVTSRFLEHLERRLGSADAVVPRTADGRHVLCAALATRLVDAAGAALAAGQRALYDFLHDCTVVDITPDEVAMFDADGRLLANVNTDQDYQRLLLGPSHASV